ncbi:hypothetical protein SCP_0700590 [Sparassis crispa]|uniref:Uncharacterized protein n=1 Tax=Sparassis crispa TaxID=139825 RepID=A0A401GRT8_9APHY|nr:hypothetical protein SCP_0700590 [Sparassis crispa]GBE84879.1 hypothetical protein SCP_0700590 [Sparassis crispa]
MYNVNVTVDSADQDFNSLLHLLARGSMWHVHTHRLRDIVGCTSPAPPILRTSSEQDPAEHEHDMRYINDW